MLLTLVNGPFAGMSDFLLPLLGFVATFTIFFGNLAACSQRNIKRMLGLSGVAHAGYLMVAVMASMIFQVVVIGCLDFIFLSIHLPPGVFCCFGVMGIANVRTMPNMSFQIMRTLPVKNLGQV